MLLFISIFCEINFNSINLNTDLMVRREKRKHMLRVLWILQNIVIKKEKPVGQSSIQNYFIIRHNLYPEFYRHAF